MSLVSAISALAARIGDEVKNKVAKTGDSMTGTLTLQPDIGEAIVVKDIADEIIFTISPDMGTAVFYSLGATSGEGAISEFGGGFLNLANGANHPTDPSLYTLLSPGQIVLDDGTGLPPSPSDDRHVVTKGYVDQFLGPSAPIPAGAIMPFGGLLEPAGWVWCDGREISRITYAALYDVIGESYGAGDGTTTFKVPDLRGEFLRGTDAGRGVDAGRVHGSWQDHEILSHAHYAISGGTYPGVNAGSGGYGGARYGDASNLTTYTGGSETRPRNVAVNFIIKT